MDEPNPDGLDPVGVPWTPGAICSAPPEERAKQVKLLWDALTRAQAKQRGAENETQKVRLDAEAMSNEILAMSADIKALKDERDDLAHRLKHPDPRRIDAEGRVWRGRYDTAMEILKEAIMQLGATAVVAAPAPDRGEMQWLEERVRGLTNEMARREREIVLQTARDAEELAERIRTLPLAADTLYGARQRWMRENAARKVLGQSIIQWSHWPERDDAEPRLSGKLSSSVTEGRAIVGELVRMLRSVGMDGTSVGERAASQWLTNTAPLVPADPIEVVPPAGRTQRRPTIDRERFSPRIDKGDPRLSPVDRPGEPGPGPRGIDGKTYTEDDLKEMSSKPQSSSSDAPALSLPSDSLQSGSLTKGDE